ncbi:MAG: Na+ dependent nucleoside transporter [Prevotellaceae bacterium]|nr:Na+ dependent nucleoside transporter [Prevotellaceae bacterium]
MELMSYESAETVPSQYAEILAERSFSFDPLSAARAASGIAALIFIAWLFSVDRKSISWSTVIKSLAMQAVIAVLVLFVAPVRDFFSFFGSCFIAVLGWTKSGSEFLFGALVDMDRLGYVFAFQILPTIIFFSALTSLLFYLGILQRAVWLFAWLMSKAIRLSGAESLSTVANIFVGMNEAPLVVKPYIAKMTKSELMLVMTAGMSTMAGGVLAAYIGMLGNGIPELEVQFARHLLTASVMAAPGAVAISKILVPQTASVERDVVISKDKLGSSIFEAVSIGTVDGLKIAGNVAAMLLVFYAMIAGGNSIMSWLGSFSLLSALLFSLAVAVACLAYTIIVSNKSKSRRIELLRVKPVRIRRIAASFGILSALFAVMISAYPFDGSINSAISSLTGGRYAVLSMQFVLGYAFAPVIWLTGVVIHDVPLVGQLLGQKIILTEFVGYSELSDMLASNLFTETKSAIMATYILCGFANFASTGIEIGGIGSIAPNQRATLSVFGMRALLGGTLSALISASIIGMMI